MEYSERGSNIDPQCIEVVIMGELKDFDIIKVIAEAVKESA